jgi:hypothetical protein
MVWYARFIFMKIYGNTRAELDAIIGGNVPPQWNDALTRGLFRRRGAEEKERFLERYKKFVDRRINDLIRFMKNTSIVASEAERQACLEKLETFRREYRDICG